MRRYRSKPCVRCGCRAEGTCNDRIVNGEPGVDWDVVELECDCICHDAWRLMNRLPLPDRKAIA